MNITVNFSSIEELREFQRTVRIAGIDEKPDGRAVPKSNEADVQVPEEKPKNVETEPKKQETAPSSGSEKPEEQPQKKGITAAELKCIAADKARAGFRSQLKTLLSDYGAKSVTDLTEKHPEKMQEFYEKLKEVCDAG